MQQTEPRSKKKIIGYAAGIIVGTIVYIGMQRLMHPSIDKLMMQTASEINKSCPIMVDQVTRLDNTIALPDKVFQYNYTVLNMDRANVDTAILRQTVEPAMINNIRTNPDMKAFRTNKVTIVYNYKDTNGVYVTSFTIGPNRYSGE